MGKYVIKMDNEKYLSFENIGVYLTISNLNVAKHCHF